MKKCWIVGVLAVSLARGALAQFSPALLQNDSYWNDGKAEFSIYGAEIVRYGVARPCEILHILVREPFDPKQLVKAEGAPRPELHCSSQSSRVRLREA